MKFDQKHINQLLKAYREDTISIADRHFLEKLALDDPMLFDALEGFALYGSQKNSAAILRINSKITQKKSRIISLQNLSIAAGLIILLGATFWLNRSIEKQDALGQVTKPKTEQLEKQTIDLTDAVENERETPSEILQNGEQITGKTDIESFSLEGKSSSDINPNKTEEIGVPQKDTDPVISKTNTTDAISEQEKQEVGIPQIKMADEEKETQSDRSESIPTRPNVAEVKPKEIPNPSTSAAPKKRQQAQTVNQVQEQAQAQAQAQANLSKTSQSKEKRIISGQIRDITGEPLIGATILLDNFSEAAITGINGRFELELDNFPTELYVSYTGFSQMRIALDPKTTEYDLVLEETGELSEVVVFGSAPNVIDDKPKFLLPPGGRGDYKKVITAKTSQSPCDQKGKVRLKFTVDKFGQVADFEIKKSLSMNCDQAAIEIIKNSGRWVNPFDSAKKVRYNISF